MQIVLKNKPGEKQKLLAALESFSRDHQLADSVLQAADLALEEHLTNVMNYAHEDGREHDILVRFETGPALFIIEVEDDGKPFNPLEAAAVDPSMPLDQKPVGGLGIHLIRSFMDGVHYERRANRNVLRMTKRLGPPTG